MFFQRAPQRQADPFYAVCRPLIRPENLHCLAGQFIGSSWLQRAAQVCTGRSGVKDGPVVNTQRACIFMWMPPRGLGERKNGSEKEEEKEEHQIPSMDGTKKCPKGARGMYGGRVCIPRARAFTCTHTWHTENFSDNLAGECSSMGRWASGPASAPT
mmetsp:Transcript_20895/g.37297  ORF Transcript_20895/g.37297 Transcript_20895/m.37297 type:complete len:157 (-) Transcript_20895:1238-1708(-)